MQPSRVEDGVPVTVVAPEDVVRHLEALKASVLPDSVGARVAYLVRPPVWGVRLIICVTTFTTISRAQTMGLAA